MLSPPLIEISDNDETASEPEGAVAKARRKPVSVTSTGTSRTATSRLGKRKLEDVPFEEKVVWTDDSAEEEEEQRARSKRRSNAAKGKGKVKGKTRRKRNSSRGLSAGVKSVGEASEPEDHVSAAMPEYLQERRRAFDRGFNTLREAGLRLPPNYAAIDFSDDEYGQPRKREQRPVFDSSVTPSRPKTDVELECSAGVIPACIAQYLRDYQVAGVRFLHELFVYQKGGILGDDMGLGKTVQVAAFLTAAFGKSADSRDKKRLRKMKQAGRWYPRVLIVCPGSLIENWKQELARWGWWNVEVFHGPEKMSVLQTARSGSLEIMVTTYATYKNHRNLVNAVSWDAVVADECHCLKDRRSETTRAMNEINALCRIGLTGTAIQNSYEELWTLLNWTNPGRFGTFAEWRNTIGKPLTRGQSHDASVHELNLARQTAKKLVHNLLPEFFLRRMKTLIADQLPKKSDRVVFCSLTARQRDAYETFLASEQVALVRDAHDDCDCGSGKKKGFCCYKQHSDGRPWPKLVFPSILALQNLASHLTLLIPGSNGEKGEKLDNALATLKACLPNDWQELYRERDSLITRADPELCGKWKVLGRLLRFWHESGDKVLVFSHSVRLLHILQLLFRTTSYSVSYLDGKLSFEERQQVVDNFNSDPSQFVFLISTKAGGVGLNITSANKVVIFDPHWNPAHDLQAQDRAYRIGQVRDVDVFRLISAGTIEEIKYARQIYKQQQANIGYSASTERRYFKGVQQDKDRKGEIFGLANMFLFRADQVVLREIVNKTNIAEAKADVLLADIDLEALKDDEDDEYLIKKEDSDVGEDGGLSQLAAFITTRNRDELLSAAKQKANRAKSDAVQAILASAGVEYTHENSEVIGSSRVEAQLSRRAELVIDSIVASGRGGVGSGGATGAAGRDHRGDDVLFADTQANKVGGDDEGDDDDDDEEYEEGDSVDDGHADDGYVYKNEPGSGSEAGSRPPGKRTNAKGRKKSKRPRLRYNPPADVMHRQFCTMARDFGFADATEFALVVEGWTQEQRRDCLDAFYRQREAKLLVGLASDAGGFEKKEDTAETETKAEQDEKRADGGDVIKVEDDTVLPKSEAGVGLLDRMSIKDEKGGVEPGPAAALAKVGSVTVKRESSPDIILIDDDEKQEHGTAIPRADVKPESAIAPAVKRDKGASRTSWISLFDTDDEDNDEL